MKSSVSGCDHVSVLLERIKAIAQNKPGVLQDEMTRAALLQASRELTASLEQPDEVISNVAFSGGRYMCVRMADDLKMFDSLVEKKRTITDLAKSTGAEE